MFFFRTPSEEDDYQEPKITVGAIVFGALLRSALLILFSFFGVEYLDMRGMWWITAFLIWFLAIYPAYKQYEQYQKRIANFQQDTLCGKCKHFEPSSQLCKILDVHVTRNEPPCEGELWEPISYED